MKYFSTRNKENLVTSIEAILHGLACDGGLYLPEVFPRISDLEPFLSFSYQELATTIIHSFFPDFSKECIQQCVHNAYDTRFDCKEITPLKQLNNCGMIELFHGPTYAFKDVALSFLPQIMSQCIEKNNVLILTATSGDTGKAALEGFRDVSNVNIIVTYPEDGVSQIQKLQMQTSLGKNVAVFAIEGNFDDCQRIVKQAYQSPEILDVLNTTVLSSANSINIGRLVPQIVYYFYGYLQSVKNGTISLGEKIDFVVPTGNFGDILAGYFAKEMGLPIQHLISASNSNRVICDFLATGTYNRKREFVETMSPSMDILVSSNLERLLYLVSKDSNFVKDCMERLDTTGSYTIPSDYLQQIQSCFIGYWANEQKCANEIKQHYEENHIVIDPHTAVAFHALRMHRNAGYQNKAIVLSTASPFKFPHSVLNSLGVNCPQDSFQALEKLSQFMHTPIPTHIKELQELPLRFKTTIKKEDAITTIASFLKEGSK